MVSAIETRELISVVIGGICLRGTYHKAQDPASHFAIGRKEKGRVGVLFLNSGFAPRAAGGDSAIYWADSFAKSGYPSFRFDLPGLGDSDGELPSQRMEFARMVNSGHYATFISGATKILTERYSLSGVVMVGHCAGAVSAFYAAAASKSVRGVVALEPYFFREEVPVRTDIRKAMSRWALGSKLARQLSSLFGRLKKLCRTVTGNELPKNANLPLLRCCSRLASAGLPMLMLNAHGPNTAVGEFDYFRHVQNSSGRAGRMVVKIVGGANHSLADDVGRTAVRQNTEQWLKNCFPLVEREEMAFSKQLTVNHQG